MVFIDMYLLHVTGSDRKWILLNQGHGSSASLCYYWTISGNALTISIVSHEIIFHVQQIQGFFGSSFQARAIKVKCCNESHGGRNLYSQVMRSYGKLVLVLILTLTLKLDLEKHGLAFVSDRCQVHII